MRVLIRSSSASMHIVGGEVLTAIEYTGRDLESVCAGNMEREVEMPRKGTRRLSRIDASVTYLVTARHGPYPIGRGQGLLDIPELGLVLAGVDCRVVDLPRGYLGRPNNPDSDDEMAAALQRPRGGRRLAARLYSAGYKDTPLGIAKIAIYGGDGRRIEFSDDPHDAYAGIPSRTVGCYTFIAGHAQWLEYWPGAYLGFQIAPHSVGIDRDHIACVRVTDVDRDGPARRAGIQVGDVLTQIGELPAGSALLMGELRPGEKVRVRLRRGGKGSTLTLAPIADPPLDGLYRPIKALRAQLRRERPDLHTDRIGVSTWLSKDKVPAGFRPAKIELLSCSSLEASRDKARTLSLTFRNVPIPPEFWACPAPRTAHYTAVPAPTLWYGAPAKAAPLD